MAGRSASLLFSITLPSHQDLSGCGSKADLAEDPDHLCNLARGLFICMPNGCLHILFLGSNDRNGQCQTAV